MTQIITLPGQIDFAAWRDAARRLRSASIPPDEVIWRVDEGGLLPLEEEIDPPQATPFHVPSAFMSLAQEVILHRAPERFDLLYRLLWRLAREHALMGLSTDPDIAMARSMAHQVSKASHKMKAFVRFRQVCAEPETFVAWFEPPHRVLERTTPFFIDRFANQRFSILTPDSCLHWDLHQATFTPGASAPPPVEDQLETWWLTYYASIFNPARLKVRAMQSEMPKRYWRNLPEAALIPSLVAEAEERSRAMVSQPPTTPARRIRTLPTRTSMDATEVVAPASLEQLGAALDGCRRCDLSREATQGVAGAGPSPAPLMIVGEQPGDAEDIAGKPFVGPAGQLLDRALAAAGVARDRAYVTNAVKHFKHEVRGRRRLHKTPDSGEVQACRWWLDREREFVAPRVILALGGTAAAAVFGRPMPVMKSRGRFLPLDQGAEGFVTVHPSYLLRVPDEAAKAAAWTEFVADLVKVRERLESLTG